VVWEWASFPTFHALNRRETGLKSAEDDRVVRIRDTWQVTFHTYKKNKLLKCFQLTTTTVKMRITPAVKYVKKNARAMRCIRGIVSNCCCGPHIVYTLAVSHRHRWLNFVCHVVWWNDIRLTMFGGVMWHSWPAFEGEGNYYHAEWRHWPMWLADVATIDNHHDYVVLVAETLCSWWTYMYLLCIPRLKYTNVVGNIHCGP